MNYTKNSSVIWHKVMEWTKILCFTVICLMVRESKSIRINDPLDWKEARKKCQSNDKQLPTNSTEVRQLLDETNFLDFTNGSSFSDVTLWMGGSFQWRWFETSDLDFDDVINDCSACHCALLGSNDGHVIVEAEQCLREVTYFLCEKQGSCSHGNSTNAEGYVQMTSSCLYKYRKPQGEVTWQEAHDLCLANQSELARFQNKLNYSTVELLNLLAETSAWIGLTKKWQWLDGTIIPKEMTPWTDNDHEGSRCLALSISVDTADKEGSLTLKIMPKRCENAHNFMCLENNKEATGKTIDMEMAVEGNKQKGRFSTAILVTIVVLVIVVLGVVFTAAAIACFKKTYKWNTQKSASVAPTNGITDQKYQHSVDSTTDDVEYVIMRNPVYCPSEVPQSSDSLSKTLDSSAFSKESKQETKCTNVSDHTDATYCHVLPQKNKPEIQSNENHLEGYGDEIKKPFPAKVKKVNKMTKSPEEVKTEDRPKAFDKIDSDEHIKGKAGSAKQIHDRTPNLKNVKSDASSLCPKRQMSLKQELSKAVQKRQSQMDQNECEYLTPRSSVLSHVSTISSGGEIQLQQRQQLV